MTTFDKGITSPRFQAVGASIVRTLNEKAQDIVCFQDRGAVGNNVADDTVAMQATIDALSASGGGTVIGRPGSIYKITSALVLKSNVVIDLGGATITQHTNNVNVITAPTAVDINGWGLVNGVLKYNTPQDGTSTVGVLVTGALNAGDKFIGLTSGATGRVVGVVSGVLTYLAGQGTLASGESISVNNQTQATTTATPVGSKLGNALRVSNGAFSYNFLVDRLTILDAYDGIVCPSTTNTFSFVGQITNYIASVARWAINYNCDSSIGGNTNVIFQNCWHVHSQVPRAPFSSGFFFNGCSMFRWDSLLADKIEDQFLFMQTSSGEVGTLSLESANVTATANLATYAIQLSDSSVSIDTVKFIGNSFKSYVTMSVTITGTIAVGNTIVGVTSGARGTVISVASGRVTFTQDTINANFQNGETVQVSGVTQGTVSAAPSNSGTIALLRATTATRYNQYTSVIDNFVTTGNDYAGLNIFDLAPTSDGVSSGPYFIYNNQATLDRTNGGVNITGTLRVGNTITGATSGASGILVSVGTFLILYKPLNFIPWIEGENVQVSGVTQATALANPMTPGYIPATQSIRRWNGIDRQLTPDPTYVDAPGYLGKPAIIKSANYTCVYTDSGKVIQHPITDNNARTFTIPPNSSIPYPIGTELRFENLINTVTIAITTDTMYLSPGGTTGSRTLAAFGQAIARKVSSTSWVISGTGLT